VATIRRKADLCVYGGTSAGVTAAVSGVRRGLSVVLVSPSQAPGGMSSGGLGATDIGNRQAVGGLARAFYRENGSFYGAEEEWALEPHRAEAIFRGWLDTHGVEVFYETFLESVRMDGRRITALQLESGLEVTSRAFVDATYEGDLMAAAGVRYTVGRESHGTYGEPNNGMQIRSKHQVDVHVDPYRTEGIPSSGLLPMIENGTDFEPGAGDHRIQAYCFRLCLTRKPGNRLAFPRPEGYDRNAYEILARMLRAGWEGDRQKFDAIPGDKVDKNNFGGFSTDYIGGNFAFPEGDYTLRQTIFENHLRYQQGLFWFLTNDKAVPRDVRDFYASWGLCRDEFVDYGGWSRELYVREGRRMVSDVVVTEHHVSGERVEPDPVAFGSYFMDSHNCRRLVRDGRVMNEGDVFVPVQPYGIAYRAMVPRIGEAENLLVTCAVSASHIAFGSLRMEPVFMVLGEVAGLAASILVEAGGSAQALDYGALRSIMEAVGLTTETPAGAKDPLSGV